MRKTYILYSVLALLSISGSINTYSQAVIFKDDSASISFFSSAPLEDISAINNSSKAILNSSTGEIAVLVTIEGFIFNKNLMQKHFNEQYMESDIYPEASFTGNILDLDIEKLNEEPMLFDIQGIMSIHGVEKKFEGIASLTKKAETIYGSSEFFVLLDDHKIKRPRVLRRNIAERVKVDISLRLISHN